jgi:hypothetical protein
MVDFLAYVFGQLFDLFCLQTGKRLLPLLSGGRVVLKPSGVRWGWWTLVKRLPDGHIGVDTVCATLTGFGFWLAMVVCLFGFLHYLSIR